MRSYLTFGPDPKIGLNVSCARLYRAYEPSLPYMRKALTLALFVVFTTASAQQWELVTPIKSTGEFKDLVMVNEQVGYLADRLNGTILATADGGVTWQRRMHLLQG